jgi:hypothetical protein
MKRTRIIQLNDKKIFLCDLKGAHNDDLLDVSQEAFNLFHTEIKEGEKVNFLIDITNTDISQNVIDEISSVAEQYKGFISKEGVVGLYGFKKTLLNLYGFMIGSRLKAFESQESAMHWLAS